MTLRALGLGLRKLSVRRYEAASMREREELVAVEEPLSIRVNGDTLAITLRTPGHDHELCAGFLLAEGLIRNREDLVSLQPCLDPETGRANAVDVEPAPGLQLDLEGDRKRGTLSTAACGLCGRQTIEDLKARLQPVEDASRFSREVISRAVAALPEHQPNFNHSGGLHAAALIRPDGGYVNVREDVGRHNAVDKVLGRALLDDQLPLSGHVLLVSGRISFEIVQKACAARIPLLVAISAPTSLAVECAESLGISLVAFARGQRLNAYAGAERLLP